MTKEAPNPGSEEALKLGCTCPVMDNAHGEGIPGSDAQRMGRIFGSTVIARFMA